ncbi:MAG: glycerophosphodiester phosphodiesterase family protein [Rhodobacteraceae bacterium]|nr:glycerophosphodiester phosphodiesterase family protein [Paracoccaceae bacterium]
MPPEIDPFEYARGADIIHLCWENMDRPQASLDTEFLAEATRRGQRIALWHEEDPVRMQEIRHLPVFGICSDRPELIHPFRPPHQWPVNIVCHRGATEFAPENTLPAFHCAFAAGFSCVEIDVHNTCDGNLAVIHDLTLNRTTNRTGAVSWQSAKDLAMLDAGSWMNPHFHNEGVPELRSVLDLARHYDGTLYIELKSADPARLLDEVIDSEMLPRCFFWSFDFATLKTIRALSPTARIMVRRQDHQSLRAATETLSPEIIEYALDDDWREIIQCQSYGIQVMIAYMGRDPAIFDRIIKLRPDFINLNSPFAFREHLHKYQKLS